MKFSKWYEAVAECEKQGMPYVIATVLGAAGSIPRDQGSKMVITASDEFDTLGGGHLEFSVTQKARDLMAGGVAGNQVEHFPLGATLGQCCGGSVTVLMESFVQQGMNLTVFGAGHVAKSLMTILGGLPGQVRWVDSRSEMFPESVPSNVQVLNLEHPQDIIETLPANSQILILTHNHQLDFDLVELAVKRGDFSYLGCIGSDTKAERFQMRLKHRGFNEEQVDSLICPVGNQDIPGKLPMEVAVSMCGELIAHLHQYDEKVLRQGVSWKQMKSKMTHQTESQLTIVD